jgi:hypothetical protein
MMLYPLTSFWTPIFIVNLYFITGLRVKLQKCRLVSANKFDGA